MSKQQDQIYQDTKASLLKKRDTFREQQLKEQQQVSPNIIDFELEKVEKKPKKQPKKKVKIQSKPMVKERDEDQFTSSSAEESADSDIDINSHLQLLNSCLTNREPSSLDKQTEFLIKEDKKVEMTTKSAAINKEKYLESYVSKIKVPSQYVLDSKINSKFHQFSIQLIKYVFPVPEKPKGFEKIFGSQQKNQVACIHDLNGKLDMKSIQKLRNCKKYHEKIIMRGLEREGQQLQQRFQIVLDDAVEALIQFSNDGNILAIFSVNRQKLPRIKIYQIQQNQTMKDMQRLIKRNNPTIEYPSGHKVLKGDEDISFIKHIKFDVNNRYLIGYGAHKVLIFDFDPAFRREQKIITIDNNIYGDILALQFSSFDEPVNEPISVRNIQEDEEEEEDSDQLEGGDKRSNSRQRRNAYFDHMYVCFVACERLHKQQVAVFNICEHLSLSHRKSDNYEQLHSCDMTKKGYNFNYTYPHTKSLIVEIAPNFKQFVLMDENEKLLLEEKTGYYSQTNLNHLRGKVCFAVCNSPETNAQVNGGFYFIVSNKFSQTLQLMHSHEDKAVVKFKRDVQPDMIKIHDLNVQNMHSKDTNGYAFKMARVQGMRDNEFILDKAEFKEKIVAKKDIVGNSDQKEWRFDRKILKVREYIFSSFRAYSVNWPYICFSGLGNDLCVINAFQQNIIHMIQVAPDNSSNMTIVQTYITDTKDLFMITMTQDSKKDYKAKQTTIVQNTNTDLEESTMDDNPAIYKMYKITLDNNAADMDSYFYQRDENGKIRSFFQLGDPLFEYNSDEVNNENLISMHVRGSSSKQGDQDRNQKLMVFLHHKTKIYYWTKKSDFSQESKLQVVSECHSRALYPLSDQSFVYLKNLYSKDGNKDRNGRDQPIAQYVVKIDIEFSSFEMTTVIKDTHTVEKIKSISMDQSKNRLLIFSKQLTTGENSGIAIYRFKLYDIDTQKTVFKDQIKNELLIGILKSGLYTFVNGHIYFNNDVIKLRYDLVDDGDMDRIYKECEVFDYYLDIIPLSDTQKMKSDTPFDSVSSHRLVYVCQDNSFKEPQTLQFFPYPHERRIYLNQNKMNSTQFYTSIITLEEDEHEYNKTLLRSNEISQNNENAVKKKMQLLFKGELSKVHKKMKLSFTSIVCLDFEQYEQQVFSQNGKLINTFNFKHLCKQYGEIVSVSGNGQNFVFKKTLSELKSKLNETKDPKQFIREFFTISIINMSVFGMSHVKDIDIYEGIKNDSQTNKNSFWLQFIKPDHMIKGDVTIKVELNSNMDICARVKNTENEDIFLKREDEKYLRLEQLKSEDKKAYEKEMKSQPKEDLFWGKENRTERDTFYYFEKGYKDISVSDLSPLFNKSEADALFKRRKEELEFVEQYLKKNPKKVNKYSKETSCFGTSNHRLIDFTIDQDAIFFWSRSEITHYMLNKQINLKNRISGGFKLDVNKHVQGSYIKQVIPNNNPENVLIKVQQTPETSALLIWGFQKNLIHRELYGLSNDQRILFDHHGRPIYLENKNVNMMYERCAFQSFDYQDIKQLDQLSTMPEFAKNKGFQFDGYNNNWLILQEYLAIPFSYMTFVILDKIEKKDEEIEGNIFDLEPYNYIFNRGTCFTDGMFVYKDAGMLNTVLSEFLNIDKVLLDQLYYVQDVTIEDDAQSFLSGITKINIQKINILKKKQVKRYDDVNTVLHMALNSGNNRSVECLLHFLSQSNQKSSRNFMTIMSKLVLYKNFLPYFESLPVQTSFMQQKQVMKVMKEYSKQIVSMGESNTLVIQNDFYRKKMKEDEDGASFPVNVFAMRVGWILTKPEGQQFLQSIAESENMDLYNVPAIKCIIEFLYSSYTHILMIRVLPIFLLQVAIFHTNIFLNERSTQLLRIIYGLAPSEEEQIFFERKIKETLGVSNEDELQQIKVSLMWLNLANFVIILLMINERIHLFKRIGCKLMLKKYTFWTDLFYVIINVWIAYFQVQQYFEETDSQVNTIEADSKWLRYLEVVGILIIYVKGSYYLSLSDDLGPLMDIVKSIVYDIRYFVFIVCIYGFCFATCFRLIAFNQIQYDDISEDELEETGVPYDNLVGASWYVIDGFMLGDINRDPFTLGKGSQDTWLSFLFLLAMMLMLIHLLNMLIAIMGNTFAERSAVAEQIKSKDHLSFVMDNWHLLFMAFKKLEQVKYIIAAFYASNEDQNLQVTEQIRDQVNNISTQLYNLKSFILDMAVNQNFSNSETQQLIKTQDPKYCHTHRSIDQAEHGHSH